MDYGKLLNARRFEFSIIENSVDGKYIKEFRRKYNLTQVDLANIFGLSKKAIEKWEQGKNGIKGGNAILIRLMMEDESILKKVYYVKLIEPNHLEKKKYIEVETEEVENVVCDFNNIQMNNKVLYSNEIFAAV